MIGLLLALYPARWRRRYGEEFRLVLEARPLGPFDVADVLIGALDARLALRLTEETAANGGHIAMLRIGGFGAIVGPALWFVGIAGASASEDSNDAPWLVLVLIGTFGILLALAGLSAFQAHREPRLAWAAFAIPGIGMVISLAGLTGMFFLPDESVAGSWSGWSIWMMGLLTMFIGSILFAISTLRAAVLSERGAIALAASSVIAILVAAGTTSGVGESLGRLLVAASMLAFAASWITLGVSALRRGPIRAIAPA